MPTLIDPDKMNCILPATGNLGAIYLGNLKGAIDTDLLREHKIRAVLTTSGETGIRYDESAIYFHHSNKITL
jgi:hypothetical protein